MYNSIGVTKINQVQAIFFTPAFSIILCCNTPFKTRKMYKFRRSNGENWKMSCQRSRNIDGEGVGEEILIKHSWIEEKIAWYNNSKNPKKRHISVVREGVWDELFLTSGSSKFVMILVNNNLFYCGSVTI